MRKQIVALKSSSSAAFAESYFPERAAGNISEADLLCHPTSSTLEGSIQKYNSNMSLSPRLYTQVSRLPRELLTACSITLATRSFSVQHRPAPNYPGHVPLTSIERGGLAVGSAVMAFFNPYRAGMN